MIPHDYAKVAIGMAWLNEHLARLDGLDIVAITATPHSVSIQLGNHEEARTVVAELADITGFTFREWEQPSEYLTFEADCVIDVADSDSKYDRLSVRVAAVETPKENR